MALNLREVFNSQRLNLASNIHEDKEPYKVKCSNRGEQNGVTESMPKQRTGDEAEDGATDRSAKAHQTGDGTNRR